MQKLGRMARLCGREAAKGFRKQLKQNRVQECPGKAPAKGRPIRGDLKKGAITYAKGRRPSIRQFIGPRGVGRERPLQWSATRLIDE